ncbi:histone deacetylase family protein [Thiomicrorhabdus lithotrophica]|uniref:Histone deacetylase family protein n=1 Tax=Thiomicrorhabdus lithotrophica TaxID=2949997 RepID=A0ABY8CC87_9GAMM|nr:histone deacetylase family protein [Thiomicrorhabdus lithotrophica]WEJ62280.1 histone deacetylase family protein [Thiomicrorhabdus lithotrophica]
MNLYISNSLCLLHDNGLHHPETAERVSRIKDQLICAQMFDWFAHHESRAATNDEIALVHHPKLIDELEAKVPKSGVVEIAEDVNLCPDSIQAAKYAVGAVLDGIDAVDSGDFKRVFCNVRPPGHHAEYDEAQGFCFFNNVAIGAAYAIEKYGYKRVAIIDFDVHHGNGTESYARKQPKVWFGSSFEFPLYPFTEPKSDIDNMVKLPLEKYSNGEVFRQAWSDTGLPALEKFKPELILISAGFDGHALDPMGNLQLHEFDFAWITAEIGKIADQHSGGKIVSVLEGGYDLGALSVSAREHIRTLFELD